MILALASLFQLASAAPPPKLTALPFALGEALEYESRFNFLRPGPARLAVEAIDTVRGVPSWRFSLTSRFSAIGLFTSTSTIQSWTGIDDWKSRRFVKDNTEGSKTRHEDFLIFPDSGYFRRNADAPKATVAAPLDDIAFIYWIRTQPLEVGKTYRFERYFRKEKNPVVVEVVKRQAMEMPDGSKQQCLVLHPVVDEDNGMFSRKSDARLWLTDDARRLPVQITSTYAFGTVSLVLKKITTGRGG